MNFRRQTVTVLSIIILGGLLLCPLLRKTPWEGFGPIVRPASSSIKKFKSDNPPKKLMNEELTDIPKSPKSSGYRHRYALAEDYWEELTMATWTCEGCK